MYWKGKNLGTQVCVSRVSHQTSQGLLALQRQFLLQHLSSFPYI